METYAYDEYGQVASVTQSGAVARTYTYAYKDNAAHELESIATGTYKFYPQTDKQGRNSGREIWNNNTKLAAEYISYRKVGDHATNMPATIRFGNKVGERFALVDSLRYAYDKMGNIEKVYENGELAIRYQYDALNRLIREDNKTLDKTYVFVYDNNGNMASLFSAIGTGAGYLSGSFVGSALGNELMNNLFGYNPSAQENVSEGVTGLIMNGIMKFLGKLFGR